MNFRQGIGCCSRLSKVFLALAFWRSSRFEYRRRVAFVVVFFAFSTSFAQPMRTQPTSRGFPVLGSTFDQATARSLERSRVVAALPMDLSWGLP
jgi:hypothetical protein